LARKPYLRADHFKGGGSARDPTPDAVIILDSDGAEVESIRLLDALHEVLRDRVL